VVRYLIHRLLTLLPVVAVGERDGRGLIRYRGRLLSAPQEALAIYHRLDSAYLANLVRSLGLDR
jgi:hypothetical protein